MINVDDSDEFLGRLEPEEMWALIHIAKRMRANRMTAWPSITRIAKDCRWTRVTARKWRDSLVSKGILSMEERDNNTPIYRMLVPGIGIYRPLSDGTYFEEDEPGQKLTTTPGQKLTTPRSEIGHPPGQTLTIKVINNYNDIKNKEDLALFCGAIIQHLNSLRGSDFRADRKSTVEKIFARAKEGFTLEDFFEVNTYKYNEWKDDPKFSKFIQPDTLYSASHFEGYLQSAKSAKSAHPAAAKADAIDGGKKRITDKEIAENIIIAAIRCDVLKQEIEDITSEEFDILVRYLRQHTTVDLPHYHSYIEEIKRLHPNLPAQVINAYAKNNGWKIWVKTGIYKTEYFRNLYKMQVNEKATN